MQEIADYLLRKTYTIEEAAKRKNLFGYVGVHPIHLVADKPGGKIGGFYRMKAFRDWEELYAYLAQGEYEERVEVVFKEEFPREYEIFDGIRRKVALK